MDNRDSTTAAEAIEARRVATALRVDSDPSKPQTLGPAVAKRDSLRNLARRNRLRNGPTSVFVLYLKNFEEQLDGDSRGAMGFSGGDAGRARIRGDGLGSILIIRDAFMGNTPARGLSLCSMSTQLKRGP